MLILDTDHFSELLRGSDSGLRLLRRLTEAGDDVSITVISLEEQSRGWLARIKKATSADETVQGYQKLLRLFQIAAQWTILSWDQHAAREFDVLRARHKRVGTMDLRIASIAIATDSRLLSRNLKDFERIGGLVVQDWLER
jgi:tRNA(fMet)-specific endonuclease VapC